MTRSIFGWDLPPGCTQRHIDELFRDAPCATCGGDPADCACPECPICGETGNEYCYEAGHLKYTTDQLIGRANMKIEKLQHELDGEKRALSYLEEDRAREQQEEPPKSETCVGCGQTIDYCTCNQFDSERK